MDGIIARISTAVDILMNPGICIFESRNSDSLVSIVIQVNNTVITGVSCKIGRIPRRIPGSFVSERNVSMAARLFCNNLTIKMIRSTN